MDSQSSTANLQLLRSQLCIMKPAVSLVCDKIQPRYSHIHKYPSVPLISFLLSPLVFVTGGGCTFIWHTVHK